MAGPSSTGPAKRGSSASTSDSPRKRINSELERLREIQAESAQLQQSINQHIVEACIAATKAPTLTPEVDSTPSNTIERPRSATLLDFNFTKSKIFDTANGTKKVVTISSTEAAKGTAITTLGPTSFGGVGHPCRHRPKGCPKVCGNKGAEAKHALDHCPFRNMRAQTSIRTSSSLMSLFLRPSVVVRDADEESRERAAAERVAAAPAAQRSAFKLRKDGQVDRRAFNRGSDHRNRYSAVFKAKVLRAYEGCGNWHAVVERLSPNPNLPMSVDMCREYVE